MNSAKEIIETFWRIQDEGDYTKVVEGSYRRKTEKED